MVKRCTVSVVRRSLGRAALGDDVRGRSAGRRRDELASVRVGDDVAAVIHDENGAAAHAGLLQPPQDAVERNHGGQHAAELVVHLQRDGHDEGRAVVGAERQRIAAKDHRLRASRKGALQGLADEGVLVGAEVAGAGALGVLADGGQVETVGVAGDEIFEQARDLRRAHRVVDLVEQAR